MATLRHIARLMVPWWLFVDEGRLVVEGVATLVDAYRQRLRDGLEARLPSRAGDSALKLIGAYRLIPRGRSETSAHYAARLKAWRNPRGHRVRGSAYGLLSQVHHYWGGATCHTRDVNGNYRALDADANPSYVYGVSWDWDGGAASDWGRQWVFVDLNGTASAHDEFAAGGTIGIAGTTPGDWVAMRRLVDARDPHRWMAAGTQPEWLIVNYIAAEGAEPFGIDATWARWGKIDGTDYVPARASNFRYVVLRAELRDDPGDPDQFASAIVTPYLGTIAGDPASFPASALGFTGDPASFPAIIVVPDDGDTPE